MSNGSPFLILEQPCNDAIDWVAKQIEGAGLAVVRTFDLHIARHAHTSCPCPYHGSDQCDCQMVVLLVYGNHCQPVSIVAHGYNRQTWFSVVDTPQQRADPRLEADIRLALASHLSATQLNQLSQSHTPEMKGTSC